MADQIVPITLPITFSKVCEVVNQNLLGTNGRQLFGPGGQFAIATGVFDPNYVGVKDRLSCFRGYYYQTITLGSGSVLFVAPYNESNSAIYLYNPDNNSTTLLNTSAGDSTGDIAHTANKMWLYPATGSGTLKEYNITLNPYTQTFNRTITNINPSAGLCAINDTTLVTLSANTVYEANITTTTSTNTLKFSLPTGRYTTGDFVYTTTGKFIILNHDSGAPAQYYLSQYDYNTGVLEVEINITTITTTGYGLYQYNNNLYMGTGNGNIYHVSLTSPYAITLHQTVGVVIYGASQIPSFVNVSLSMVVADTIPPSTPTNLSHTQLSESEINLTWTASTDNVGVTGYEVYRSETSSISGYAQVGDTTMTEYYDGTVIGLNQYWYKVRAYDAANNFSPYSDFRSVYLFTQA